MSSRPSDAIRYGNTWVVVRGGTESPLCSTCWNPIVGVSWNLGRCRSCHEAALLPIGPGGVEETGETWADVYLGVD